jgi:hypothetical protein
MIKLEWKLHRPLNLITAKEKLRMHDQEYGRTGSYPPLQQVVPDKFYNRGDHSHIICSRCGNPLNRSEGNNHLGRCDVCESIIAKIPIPKEEYRAHNQRMLKGMVLANSCDYERWS